MKKMTGTAVVGAILALALTGTWAWAQDYTTAYTDGGNFYFVPTVRGVTRDNSAWPSSNMVFSNLSAVTGIRGRVGVTLSNVTTAGEYMLTLKDSTGAWRYFQLYHDNGVQGGVTVLPFQGNVNYETVTQGVDVHVVRGDSLTIPYSIGKDVSGWTLWFGAKASLSNTTYSVPLREITSGVTDPSTGSGLINLSVSDTSVPARRYYAEVEMRKAGSVNTVLRFYLWIDQDVIR